MTPHHDIAIIGSGFSGLAMAAALKRSGREDFVVLERAESVGGTWRDNHYPGCACDVPVPLYSFSFAPKPDWSHFFARQDEIRAYLEDCADRFEVRPHIRFGADMLAAEWEEGHQRWRLSLSDGEDVTARVVIGGFGGLNQASYPDIPGLQEFEGALFHTADWDHSVALEGRRVAVIGTGASAIQVVPQVAKVAGHLDVYQRTPPWIFPKLDRRFSGAEKWMFRRVPLTQKLLRGSIFAFSQLLEIPVTKAPRLSFLMENVAKAHMRRQVRDPDLRRKLTPSYRSGCKRMLVANDYYPALTREHVEVVTDPIQQVTARGIVTADGVEHPADVIVCGTGFSIEEAIFRMDVRGREGLTLEDAWAGGVRAHRGTMAPGFPNFMLLSGPNTGTGSTSQVFMIESQVHYAMKVLEAMEQRGAAVVEVTSEAYEAYNAWLDERMEHTVWLKGGCQSWYLDQHGRSPVLYPGFSYGFRRSLRQFREDEHVLEPARVPPRPRPVTA